MKPLPCPFCGTPPEVYPKDPKNEGAAWGQVRCEYEDCPAHPNVKDGEPVADERGAEAYRQAAIKRWNKRAPVSAGERKGT
jgi:hypothetical protein